MPCRDVCECVQSERRHREREREGESMRRAALTEFSETGEMARKVGGYRMSRVANGTEMESEMEPVS